MKTLFRVVWALIRIGLAITRFCLMKLVFGPLLRLMRPFLAAVGYLTVVPVPEGLGGARDLQRSLVCFPVVGLLLGAMVGAFAWLMPHLFGDLLAAALIVAALVVLSGGGTLGGLARSADGLLSPTPRKHMLEDGPGAGLGTAGVTAVVCVLLVKFAALAEIEWFSYRWRAAVLVPLAGRCAIVLAMGILTCLPQGPPPGFATAQWGFARAEPGRALFRKRSRRGRLLAAVWAVGVLGAAVVFYGSEQMPDGYVLYPARVVQGAVAGVLSLAAALLVAWFVRRRLGGATGETLGAVCEIAEVVMVVALAATQILRWIYDIRDALRGLIFR